MKGKAFPTGTSSHDTLGATHYRLEPSWWGGVDTFGGFVLESTVGGQTRIFISNDKAERPDGLLTDCVDGTLADWDYEVVK